MKKLLILVSVFLMAFINAALSENGPASLPAYAYQGSEKYVGAVCQYILNVENTSCVPDEAAIPCIVILETADSDPEDVRLWGDFAVFNYKLVNTTLMCQSGGSFLGMIRLKPVGDSWEVVSVDKVGDGDDYSADVKRIFGLRDGLENIQSFRFHMTGKASQPSLSL